VLGVDPSPAFPRAYIVRAVKRLAVHVGIAFAFWAVVAVIAIAWFLSVGARAQ